MAKIKKIDSSDVTKKPPVRKPPAKKLAPAQPAGVPLIDTSAAAQAAARMLLSRATSGATRPAAGEKKETSTFKQLKENLTKPPSQVMGNVLGDQPGQKQPNLPIGKQTAHNQTTGGFNRTGVPRRTGG